jgi:hypothetical protein
LLKQDGIRVEWEYPFAVAGINISFMLVQMLDLHAGNINSLEKKFSGCKTDYARLKIKGGIKMVESHRDF